MPKANDESKGSGKVGRRAVLGALAIGGTSALAGRKAIAQEPGAFVAEREWARALARHISNQLPEAIREVPGLQLNRDQVQELRKAFENTLIVNMGCEEPPSGS